MSRRGIIRRVVLGFSAIAWLSLLLVVVPWGCREDGTNGTDGTDEKNAAPATTVARGDTRPPGTRPGFRNGAVGLKAFPWEVQK